MPVLRQSSDIVSYWAFANRRGLGVECQELSLESPLSSRVVDGLLLLLSSNRWTERQIKTLVRIKTSVLYGPRG